MIGKSSQVSPLTAVHAPSTVRVGLLTAHNAYDKNAFSGILYHMHMGLVRAGFQVIPLGIHYKPRPYHAVTDRISRHVFKTPAKHELSRDSRRFADAVNNQLANHPCDVIFAPVASWELSVVDVKQPVVYASDATFELLESGYSIKLSAAQREAKHTQDANALKRAAFSVLSSEWAATSATSTYNAEESRVAVIQFGANLNKTPDAEAVRRRELSAPINLLFLGRDWARKGGPLALETFRLLKQRGHDIRLTIIGSSPPESELEAGIRVYPMIDKSRRRGWQLFNQLLLEAHVLLFPSRADCSPVALSESAAYGLPCVASAVGGIPSIVDSGRTGILVLTNADAYAFADATELIISDRDVYKNFSRNARERYRSLLNWDSWADSVGKILLHAITVAQSHQ